MTVFKKIALTVAAVAATLCLALFCSINALSSASADYSAVDSADYFDIDGDTLKGFKSGATLPDKINLVVPDGIKKISAYAFAGNNAIVRVVLNAELESIENDAFANCNSLVEVYDKTDAKITTLLGTPLPLADTSIGRLVYSALNICYDDEHSYFRVEGDYMFCKDTRTSQTPVNYLVGYIGDGGNLTLPEHYPDGAESYNVYQYAFWSVTSITGVTMPDGVQTIGNYAFYGCTNLESVILPQSSLTQLGASAFQGCTKLSSIKARGSADTQNNKLVLPEGLKIIGSSAFSGLTAIYDIYIPSSVTLIDVYAFEGCTAGAAAINASATITFAEGDDALTVSRYSFYNCSGLKVVKLPERLSVLYARAFAGCTSLAFAYLPDGVNYTTVSANETLYFEPLTAIIYDGYTAYYAAINADYIKNHESNMTYIITVNFYESESADEAVEVTSEQRLYGASYQYVQAADLTWATVDSTQFPKQTGYANSVWYLDGSFATKASIANVSALLRSLKDSQTDQINLYAHLMVKPTLSAVAGLVYDEDTSYGSANIKSFIDTPLSEESFNELYSILIDGESGNVMSDAGSYAVTVGIRDTDNYGEWTSPVPLTVAIAKKPVDIGELHWNMDTYDMGVVYLYENAEGKVYPAYTELKPEDIPVGYTYAGAKTVFNSIVRFRRAVFTITLNAAEHAGKFTIEYNSTNTGNEIGEYSTVATLVAGKNYQLCSERVSSPSYGQVISITDDLCTVTKTWYIVEIKNGLYTDSSLDTEYAISGWTFGETVSSLSAPVPQWGTNSIALTFTLFKNGTKIGDNFDAANFAYYINPSMPADVYDLSVFVPSYSDYIAYTQSYAFTVASSDISGDLLNYVNTNVKGKTFLFAYDGNVKTYDKGKVQLDLESGFSAMRRTGIWATSAFNGYYSSGFEISYNLARMFSNSYYTEEELENTRYKPVEPGTYTLYFQISANNYTPLADVYDDDARRSFVFETVIYGTQELPVLPAAQYTGEIVRPEITSGSLYTAEYNPDLFVGVNRYYVTFILNDPEHYVWAGSEYDPLSDGRVQVPFDVIRADNEATLTLNLIRWTWGSYSPDTNIPVWDTKFKDGSADFISYKLVSTADGTTYNYANGGFAAAPAGTYIFSAYAKGYVEGDSSTYGYNWNALKSSEIAVTVARATNRWTETPNVARWQWGKFDPDEHVISAQPLYSESGVTFSVLHGDGKTISPLLVDFRLGDDGLIPEKQAKVFASLDAGDYLLVAKVAQTVNYTGLDTSAQEETPLHFEILQATNVWESTPNVVQWGWGEYDKNVNLITARPAFGSVEYRIYTRNAQSGYALVTFKEGDKTVESFTVGEDGIVGEGVASVLSSLDADTYYLLATVVGDGKNYTGLNAVDDDITPVPFVIHSVNNYWKMSPNVVSWTYGNFNKHINSVIAETAYETEITCVINCTNGKTFTVEDLPTLKEGTYVITITAAATQNYSGLTANVTFLVFGETDTSFMNLQVGALVVMSVVLVALVGLAGVLLWYKKGGKQ